MYLGFPLSRQLHLSKLITCDWRIETSTKESHCMLKQGQSEKLRVYIWCKTYCIFGDMFHVTWWSYWRSCDSNSELSELHKCQLRCENLINQRRKTHHGPTGHAEEGSIIVSSCTKRGQLFNIYINLPCCSNREGGNVSSPCKY